MVHSLMVHSLMVHGLMVHGFLFRKKGSTAKKENGRYKYLPFPKRNTKHRWKMCHVKWEMGPDKWPSYILSPYISRLTSSISHGPSSLSIIKSEQSV